MAKATPAPPGRLPGPFWERQVAILEADEYQPDGKWHPSSSRWFDPSGAPQGRCLRALVLKMRGVPESNPPNAQARIRMRLGHWIEFGLVGDLKRAGFQLGYQLGDRDVTVPTLRFQVAYSSDIIEKIGEDLIGRDVKTVWGYSWTTVQQMPKEDHTAQLFHYSVMSGIPRWTLEYLNRGTGEALTHDLEFPDHGFPIINGERVPWMTYDSLVAGWAECERWLPGGDHDGENPPADYDGIKKWPCDYCGHQTTCRVMGGFGA